MIDSGDESRFDECRIELGNFLKRDDLKGIPILIYANKQDSDTAVQPEEIEEKFELSQFQTGREYSVQPCVAIEGIGVAEGTTWLLKRLVLPKK